MTTKRRAGSAFAFVLVLSLAGCPSSEAPDPGAPAEDLPPPDLSGVDMDVAVVDAIDMLTRATLRAAWQGHLAGLSGAGVSCPTLWTGVPSGIGDGDGGEDGHGWQDDCSVGNYAFDGSLAWATDANPDGPVLGTRNLAALATVSAGGETVFAMEGEASDSLRLDEAGGRWTYASTFNGEVSGSAVSDPDLAGIAGGWRGSNVVTWVGGARWSLSAASNLAFGDELIQGQFDAVDVETYVPGPGADELGCGLEPHGRVSLRIPPGTWVDVDFWVAPPDGADPDEIISNPCDGCGTLSVRGLGLGEACPDFAQFWTAARLPSAELDDFVLPMRGLSSED